MTLNPANGVASAALAQIAELEAPEAIRLLTTLEPSKYWGPTPRRLAVSFMESAPRDLRARIVSHLNAWNRTGCIEFVETQGLGQVRISRGQGGFFSYLGTDILSIPASRQTMNLQGFTMNTPESEYLRVVRHEAGHTLGFPHEHMRQALVDRIDPQRAYDYFLRTQGWNRQTVDQQVLTSLNERSVIRTPPDQDSIMCYFLPGEITRDRLPIRGGLDINATDYNFCGAVYPKPRPSQTTPLPNARAEIFDASGYEDSDDWSEAEDVREPLMSL